MGARLPQGYFSGNATFQGSRSVRLRRLRRDGKYQHRAFLGQVVRMPEQGPQELSPHRRFLLIVQAHPYTDTLRLKWPIRQSRCWNSRACVRPRRAKLLVAERVVAVHVANGAAGAIVPSVPDGELVVVEVSYYRALVARPRARLVRCGCAGQSAGIRRSR